MLKTLLSFSFLLFFPLFVLAQDQSTFDSKSILVCYTKDLSSSQKLKWQSVYGSKNISPMNQLDLATWRVPEGETIDSFLEQVRDLPGIEFAEPNYVYRASLTPNDPDFASQYALQSSFLNMEAAWDIETGDENIVVAVLDSGVLLTHPDLALNLWQNPSPTSTSGLNGASLIFIDNNGDGDCTDSGETCPNDDPSESASDFHGTHVAGIIAARTSTPSNGVAALDMAGIAFDSRIMAVKVLDGGSGLASWVANGIIYAADNGASVINMSLGSDFPSETIRVAVEYAVAKNVVVVAAAGNIVPSQGETAITGCGVEYPAAIDDVLAVSATNTADVFDSGISCLGPQVDISAPGQDILSTIGPTGTGTLSGTSFSAPMVAGVAALLRSINPNMSVQNVARYLTFYADDLGQSGFDTQHGFGRLNAFQSVQAAQSGTPFFSNPTDPGETFPYPNPYNPNSGERLTISLPESLGSAGLRIKIFTAAGKEVQVLHGTNEWNGRNHSGETIASGVYFYFAETTQGDATGKITVIR